MTARAALLAAALAGTAAAAQDHAMHAMPGMTMPGMAPPAPRRDPGAAASPAAGRLPPPPGPAPSGTALPPGDAPPPPPPADHYADRSFAPGAMAAARARMMREEGARTLHQILFNLAELQARRGRDGYRWDGEGWFGGDVNRLVVKSEGEGALRGRVDSAELQALWSRAIDPYFNLQGGLRQDLGGAVRRTFLTAGIEGLAPYWFQLEARLFVATTGQVRARAEAWLDQRLTQRLVLQPRAELNLAAADDLRARLGAGLTDAELGLRLRYEVRREFAPYLGVSWEARTGRTATLARATGERPRAASLVAGARFWF